MQAVKSRPNLSPYLSLSLSPLPLNLERLLLQSMFCTDEVSGREGKCQATISVCSADSG